MFQRWVGRYHFIVPSQDSGLPGRIETACPQSKAELHQKLTSNSTYSVNNIQKPVTCEPAFPSQQTHCPDASHSGSTTKLAGTQVLAPKGLP